MNEIVPHLQAWIEDHQNLWEEELFQRQEKRKQLEELKTQLKEQSMVDGPVEVQCLNCSTFLCMSDDIKKIQNSHHVLVNEEFARRLRMIRSPVPEFEEEDLKYDGAVYCSKPDCQGKLGGVCEYKHLEFPLFKIRYLRFVDRNGRNGRNYKKWKKINFYIEPFTLDDLRQIVENRRANM